MRKKLPIGIEHFEDFFANDFYYVDKTRMIAELLRNWGEVNLFTRPRRFGKSLNMNMLKTFFEIGCNKTLFEGLAISREKALCEEYMGQFPVISISLKDVGGLTYGVACAQLKHEIGTAAERCSFLAESEKLSENERKMYRGLVSIGDGYYNMSEPTLRNSLQTLSALLSKHYGKQVILLIDEYDVPLDKAFQAGYYDDMADLIRSVFSKVLKTNDSLYFAVLTGCLRISKESIFTGLNNLKVHTITDARYDEYFGFTETEVKEMLAFYGLSDHMDTVREWYDGYQFGGSSIYCPWDVINYCDALLGDSKVEPENYWANTSGNFMVRRFIDKADKETRDAIEQLIAGDTIDKEIRQELTYNELDSSIENLWSVLFVTGYLTQRGRAEGKRYRLAIPNKEIRELFIDQIQAWFKENARSDETKIRQFCGAFPKGDAGLIERLLNDYLWESISIRDTAVRKERKENFFHGMLLGLLKYESNWSVKSNVESGEGYGDILIRTPERVGIVVEIKYAGDFNLDVWCQAALEQIERNRYEAVLIEDGMKTIVKYGIAFYKKNCRVMRGQPG